MRGDVMAAIFSILLIIAALAVGQAIRAIFFPHWNGRKD